MHTLGTLTIPRAVADEEGERDRYQYLRTNSANVGWGANQSFAPGLAPSVI